MRVLIQRVSEANVKVANEVKGVIGTGMLILLGIESQDNIEDISWLCNKIKGLRIFNDADGKMNLSAEDVQASFLVISQFTLHASTKKGNRPSYIKAAPPEIAEPLYEQFIIELALTTQTEIQKGVFGADMQVHLINDGPVTLMIDSKNKE
jgi:D-aminoacyl-tRNA deacylase